MWPHETCVCCGATTVSSSQKQPKACFGYVSSSFYFFIFFFPVNILLLTECSEFSPSLSSPCPLAVCQQPVKRVDLLPVDWESSSLHRQLCLVPRLWFIWPTHVSTYVVQFPIYATLCRRLTCKNYASWLAAHINKNEKSKSKRSELQFWLIAHLLAPLSTVILNNLKLAAFRVWFTVLSRINKNSFLNKFHYFL